MKELASLNGRMRWGYPKEHLYRTWLPYGIWTCDNGREVMFNRYYEPIWERANGVTQPANPTEWVNWSRQRWFFNDGNSPWRTKSMILPLLRELKEFGGSWEPIIHYSDVMRAARMLQ